MGGDLNFSMGDAKVWGPRARPNPLFDLSRHILEDKGFKDIDLIKLIPT